MKVSEIIEILKKCDQDAEVYYDQSPDLPINSIIEVANNGKTVLFS